jgi:hypothetical protein
VKKSAGGGVSNATLKIKDARLAQQKLEECPIPKDGHAN